MQVMNETQRLFQLLSENYAQAAAELANFDPSAVVYAESGWRVQDIMSHLLAWDTEVVRALKAYRDGGSYRIPDYELERFNHARYEERKNQPSEQVYVDWFDMREQLKIVVATMTPDQLAGEMTNPSGRRGKANDLIEEITSHQLEHFADIRAVGAWCAKPS